MRSIAFLTANNGKELLALAITGHQFGARPSGIVGILDESAALDFDMAAALCFEKHQQALRRHEREHLALCITTLHYTGKLPGADDEGSEVEYV